MNKIFFEHSVFLNQKVGGISNYIIKLNQKLNDYKIYSKIISPISINKTLNNDYSKKINFLN